jgi:N-acetylglutamate synthase-like GNAT family acetyltransferase
VIRIAPFVADVPGLEDAILALILPIQQQEFGVAITAEDQPDLRRIPDVYQRGRGNFWVARDGDAVVGTIALIDYGAGGALRKMFVRADQRGTGLGQALLDRLLAHAREREIRRIVLGTLAQMHAAHRFYQRNGFERIEPDELPPEFPRVAVDNRFYARAL